MVAGLSNEGGASFTAALTRDEAVSRAEQRERESKKRKEGATEETYWAERRSVRAGLIRL